MCLLCRLSLCRPQTQIMGRNLGWFSCKKRRLACMFKIVHSVSFSEQSRSVFIADSKGIRSLSSRDLGAAPPSQSASEIRVVCSPPSVPHPKFCARKRVRVHRRRRQSGVLRLSRSLLSSLPLTLGICAHFYFT